MITKKSQKPFLTFKSSCQAETRLKFRAHRRCAFNYSASYSTEAVVRLTYFNLAPTLFLQHSIYQTIRKQHSHVQRVFIPGYFPETVGVTSTLNNQPTPVILFFLIREDGCLLDPCFSPVDKLRYACPIDLPRACD